MGYERKRGKLADLNSLLRDGESGTSRDRFSLVVGDTGVLSNVKYVITLDTDTQLPRDAAWQFVGAMVHPLNRAHYDEARQRVVGGYGILQPRVAVSLPGHEPVAVCAMCGSEAGIDPYTRAVSDVYQDLFQEGSFIGKGIYDVDAFEQALNGRFPENRILSHDLIEGCYARAGLLSDVRLYEEYPSRYSADVSRRHRWIRGDWQIAHWLLSGVPGPGPDPRLQKNPISGLSQWKIFDNLRRSLMPSALTLLLLLGWTELSSPRAPAWFWTLSVIGIILIPPLIVSLLETFRKSDDVLLGQHLSGAVRSAGRRFAEATFTFACLPYESFFSLDAILRTIWRMLVTRRRLLEWSPSDGANSSSRSDRGGLAASCRTMWIGPVIAVASAIYLSISGPVGLASAWPILGLWFASPLIAWWISRPLTRREARLTADQIIFLRNLSRKTWAFFETFVGPEDHWLPPDNYQEYRAATVAHRTSPTNMGLSLLANLSAYDFGYISAGQLIERTENAFYTMEALERDRGHFYNWYDTQSLRPLAPKYISTVDSGNLAAHLLTLRAGLLALPDHQILGPQVFDGLNDTLKVLVNVAGEADPALLARIKKDVVSASGSPPTTLTTARQSLDRLAAFAAEVAANLHSVDPDPDSEANWWTRAFVRQCQDALDDLTFFASSPVSDVDEIPTLRGLARLGNRHASERIAAIERLALQASELARMEYDFLFDKARHLLAIGYNVGERRRDSSYYDLLASEARFCSFVAIAQGQLPQENWFALGRTPHERRRRTGSAFLERFDVRVPHAASGDADIRKHAARPDLQGGSGQADRIWEAARRTVGHVGIRLQYSRCSSQLPVPRLRCSRPGAQTRTRRRSGHCTLCVGARADGGARGGVP